MDIQEFKQLYEEYGEVVAKLRVSELNAPLEDIAAEFPQALRLMNVDRYVWSNLLIKHPDISQYCDLEKFDGHCWSWMLSGNQSLLDKCPWEKLSGSDWFFLLANEPSTSHYFRKLDPARQAELIQETKFISEVLVEQ